MRTTVVVETIQPISEVKARSLSDDVLCRDKKNKQLSLWVSSPVCLPLAWSTLFWNAQTFRKRLTKRLPSLCCGCLTPTQGTSQYSAMLISNNHYPWATTLMFSLYFPLTFYFTILLSLASDWMVHLLCLGPLIYFQILVFKLWIE